MADEIVKTPVVDTPTTPETEEAKVEKSLTQEQFDKALKDRLERERNKLLKETEVKIKQAQAEAERLATLSAQEKEKELAAKTQEELKAKLRDVAVRENRLDAIELFTQNKVPTALVNYVITDDKDKTIENAETFCKTFNESVAKEVADQLKGTPPKDIATNETEQPKKVVKAF